MTDAEILQKAIEKAVKSGYRPDYGVLFNIVNPETKGYYSVISRPYQEAVDMKHGIEQRGDKVVLIPYIRAEHNTILFSHGFAKAFWGEKNKKVNSWTRTYYQGGHEFTEDVPEYIPEWQYHLQQMVLEENPLQYLAKFI